MKNTLIKLGLVLKKEIVFTAALLLAVLSSFFVPVSKEYLGYLDYRVLALLFCLMFLVAGFRKQGVFRYLGRILTDMPEMKCSWKWFLSSYASFSV